MLRRSRTTLASALTALAIAVVMSGAFVTASSDTPAHATCAGSGQPRTILRYDANYTLVAEESVTYPANTCDGDAWYSGAVLDPVTDGSCASVYYLEPLAYYAQQGASCTTGAWSVYGYADTYGGNSVLVNLRTSYLGDSWVTSSGY